MVKVCLLGFGGIAQSHRAAYENLAKKGVAKLVGVCDIRPERFETAVKINLETQDAGTRDYRCYTDKDEMLAAERPDVVDICLPTYLHADAAVEMLERGYHVQSEKPMALSYADCRRMLDASARSGKKLMIGQVLHFDPAYEFLKECVDSGRFGKPLSAFFQRLSPVPIWGYQNWFMNYDLSGGSLTDLHIHDLDMARYLFGNPKGVNCHAQSVEGKFDTCFTNLHYENLPVLCVGDWGLRHHAFEPSYRVNFEKAVVEMVSGKVTVVPADGSGEWSPELEKCSDMQREIEYFDTIVANGEENDRNTPESAAETIRLIEALRVSAENDGAYVPFEG